MNRRDILRSLITLPVAATTIERADPPTVQAEAPIGHTDLSGGRSGKVYRPAGEP